jgi:hypothetical protein
VRDAERWANRVILAVLILTTLYVVAHVVGAAGNIGLGGIN